MSRVIIGGHTDEPSLLTDNECRVKVYIISKEPYACNGESPFEWTIHIYEKIIQMNKRKVKGRGQPRFFTTR